MKYTILTPYESIEETTRISNYLKDCNPGYGLLYAGPGKPNNLFVAFESEDTELITYLSLVLNTQIKPYNENDYITDFLAHNIDEFIP